MMATARISIPIPPSQWVSDLQNSIPLDNPSISVRIDEPVVENPEDVSKTASAKFGISPEATKGMAPIMDIIIQVKDTTKKPSRIPRSPEGFLVPLTRKRPVTSNVSAVPRKIRVFVCSLYIIETTAGSIKTQERIVRTPPRMLNATL